MSTKKETPEQTMHPEVAAAIDEVNKAKEQKRFMLEAKHLESMYYDDEGKLIVRFHQGRASVNKKDLDRAMDHVQWGREFGHVGTLRNAANARVVEVQTR